MNAVTRKRRASVLITGALAVGLMLVVMPFVWMLLTSFFPLAALIVAVLGAIIFGLATPSEAAAIGALGALVLAVAYGGFTFGKLRESVILTARATSVPELLAKLLPASDRRGRQG